MTELVSILRGQAADGEERSPLCLIFSEISRAPRTQPDHVYTAIEAVIPNHLHMTDLAVVVCIDGRWMG
jgi:hypothetical protein